MSNDVMLPIGSVVRLADADMCAMIIGYEPMVGNDTSDYLGVVYPYGLVTEESAFAFDGDAIDEIVFEGYRDEAGRKVFASVRTYREATSEMLASVKRLIDELSPEQAEKMRERYAPVEMPEGFEIPD